MILHFVPFLLLLLCNRGSLKCFIEDMDFYSAEVFLEIAGIAHPDGPEGHRKWVAFLKKKASRN